MQKNRKSIKINKKALALTAAAISMGVGSFALTKNAHAIGSSPTYVDGDLSSTFKVDSNDTTAQFGWDTGGTTSIKI